MNGSGDWEKLKASSEAAAASEWADYVNRASAPDDEDLLSRLQWRRSKPQRLDALGGTLDGEQQPVP